MRLRNLSDIAVDRDLWTQLAKPLALDGILPGALRDEADLYSGNTLRVTIRPRLSRPAGRPTSSYTCGHIAIYPCPHCRYGFLTWVYLHELFHAWLDQVDESLYLSWDHCTVADRFANGAYALLGASAKSNDRCATYRFDDETARQRLHRYQQYAGTIAGRRGHDIQKWDAAAQAERLTR
jgi:hypothetical protein